MIGVIEIFRVCRIIITPILNTKRLSEDIPKLISKKYGKDFTYNEAIKVIGNEAENFAKRAGISKENALKVILNKWKKACK